MIDKLASLPPGPGLSPARQTFEWFARPYELLDRCAAEFGDTFTLRFQEFGPHVVFSHPSDIKEIFALDTSRLSAGEGNVIYSGPRKLDHLLSY